MRWIPAIAVLRVLMFCVARAHTHTRQADSKAVKNFKKSILSFNVETFCCRKKKVLTAVKDLAVKIIYLPVHTRAQFLELGSRGHSPSAYHLHIIIIIIIISIIYLHLCDLQLSPCTVDTAGWLHLPCCSENVPTRGHCWEQSLRAVN